MKKKLLRIYSPWRRLLITLLTHTLLLFGAFAHSRARIHWIGYRQRVHRLETPAIVAIFLVAALLLEPQEYVLWSIALGGTTCLFVVVTAIYSLVRKRNDE